MLFKIIGDSSGTVYLAWNGRRWPVATLEMMTAMQNAWGFGAPVWLTLSQTALYPPA